MFVAISQTTPRPEVSAAGFRRVGVDPEIAAFARQRRRRPVEAVGRQQCGQHALARGVAHAQTLRHGPERLDKARRLRGGAAERGDMLVGVEVQQRPDADGRAENPAGRGDVPAARIVIGRHRRAQPALDLAAQHEGADEVVAGPPLPLREGEQGGRHRRRRMDDRRRVVVVIVEDVGRHGVQAGGERRVGPFRPTDQRDISAGRKGRHRLERRRHGRLAGAGDGGREDVQDRALCLVPHFRRNVLPGEACGEFGQLPLGRVRYSIRHFRLPDLAMNHGRSLAARRRSG